MFFIFDAKNIKYYIISRFQIAIDVKAILIGHVFIQIKFCVLGGEGTKFCFDKTNMTNYY